MSKPVRDLAINVRGAGPRANVAAAAVMLMQSLKMAEAAVFYLRALDGRCPDAIDLIASWQHDDRKVGVIVGKERERLETEAEA